MDSIPKDLNRPWEDPLPEPGERHIAQELRGLGYTQEAVPEWKTKSMGKGVAFGFPSKHRSIAEQRESLPIFSLKVRVGSGLGLTLTRTRTRTLTLTLKLTLTRTS